MAACASQAERWRRHREAFELALELGITPREAEAELRARENRAHHAAFLARLATRNRAPALPANMANLGAEATESAPLPYWKRD